MAANCPDAGERFIVQWASAGGRIAWHRHLANFSTVNAVRTRPDRRV